MRSKKECRKEALARRALMSAKERETAGRRITDFLRDSEEYQLAEKILVYASYRDEAVSYTHLITNRPSAPQAVSLALLSEAWYPYCFSWWYFSCSKAASVKKSERTWEKALKATTA